MDTQSFHSGARPSYERMTASCLCETTKKNWTIVSKRDIFPLAFAFFYSAVIKTHIVFSTLLGHSHTSSGDVIIKLFRAWLSNPSIIRLFPHLDYHESVILLRTSLKDLILIIKSTYQGWYVALMQAQWQIDGVWRKDHDAVIFAVTVADAQENIHGANSQKFSFFSFLFSAVSAESCRDI